MEYSLLKDDTSESQHWTVRTRVVRFSEYVSNDDPPKILSLDLILLDEEGKAMEGQIPENWVPLFKPQLKEDFVYYIRYFQVCNARTTYCPVDHPYMMRFTAHTKVHEVKNVQDTFPKYACALTTYDVLRTRVGITNYCSDDIGLFTGCSHVKLQQTKGGTKHLRNVYLTDGRETTVVSLWNQHAQSFDADRYMEMASRAPVAFLFVGMTCRIFEEKLTLQGSTLCKWYANPELPEAAALQDSCAGQLLPPTWFGPTAAQMEPERITMTQLSLFTNPHIIYSNRYIITAKIKHVVPNQSWWYYACDECNKTLQPHGDKYKCTGPKCFGTIGGPRYRLSIIATDPNPPAEQQSERTIQLVFFGSTAQEIIGTPVDTLIATNQGVGMFLPRKITTLYEKKYDLRVSVSSMSLQQVNITYQVDAIVGVGTISAPTLPLLHSRQCSQQSGTESQGIHSTEKSIAITAASGSGSTPPECNKETSLALTDINVSAEANPELQIAATTKTPESVQTKLASTPASFVDLPTAQVHDPKTKKTKRSTDEASGSLKENDPEDNHTAAKKNTKRRLNLTDTDEQD
ncbi:hypothetical protein PVAP13_9KG030199 [Panicum virgatum]|uniref:Replication protein A 70 kDa DNA-binding subunit B/D first OB fold domain-containing protein n=1 Tax=Panicum virgatum TaxID=38727 RepID=A0A8T0NC08_PANVG|nr:hypothetical protein PVAP13_9KG030199 [Panicum virgatum]KAG2546393.1 hypothetical protein PVAP13_9KG030199 [Panicum virgatum]KAG2546395.1 hypothetical protein PVAP13_9KG030199 [Panicum virgatum]KAG2546396.1 hypothetical protein PVAP13_9KG030199 [Panicum virgatum]KAG2546397.1 hypothetical protein PVAP13_9KG030199 [Panicum virgatum]